MTIPKVKLCFFVAFIFLLQSTGHVQVKKYRVQLVWLIKNLKKCGADAYLYITLTDFIKCIQDLFFNWLILC